MTPRQLAASTDTGQHRTMIGLGKMWKAVTGQEGRASAPAKLSTIPRDVTAPRPNVVDLVSDLDEDAPGDTRGASRFVPHRTSTMLTTQSGKRIAARIINISQTGVALEAELADVSPQDVMTVGSRPVSPGRRITRGIVFQFKKPLDPKLCSQDIIL